MQKIRLGDLLVEKEYITEAQLMHALKLQKESNFTKKLGEIFIEEGLISEKELALVLADQLGYEFVDLYSVNIDFSLMKNFPLNLFKSTESILFKEDEDFIHVAVADPLNYDAMELLERTIVLKPLKYYITLRPDIKHVFERMEIIETARSLMEKVKKEIHSKEYKLDNEQSSIMLLIEQILKSSIANNASDIHIEPNATDVSVRNRIDGVLREIFVLDIEVYNALASRIKILGNLDISEKRRAQDGRFSMQVAGRDYDFRLSTAPTMHGESIVMRILDQQKILLKLNELGMQEKNLKKFEDLLKAPYGIIFVTGPTGSGKTTTLYAALNEIKDIENKIITIEDPIEYQLPLVQQMQTNDKIGYGFNDVLRSVLRQDPDIIMVGEIRDEETLSTATGASLTGHLVFSTLHTNDAPSAITRMAQMGLQSYLIADSLVGIVTQRLVRKICPYCKKEHKPQLSLIKKVKEYLPENPAFYLGQGCSKCGFSGYLGRVMICEILTIDDTLSAMIAADKNKYEIFETARQNGFEPMIVDGIEKALEGVTSLEEVTRVVKI
ncbi:MAG: general secretion pathway protein GspE [Campylobacteraceae bacterium 4484_4]|nr:MAG: general secretion pathway protein GspE [Campylobacteraceae bacterium 4484_4]